jgi:hypothetical protein
MKKGLLSIFLFIFIAVLISAQNESDFEIEQNRQGKITIKDYIGSITDVVIPSKISGIDVTEIVAGAFNGKRNKNQWGNIVEKHKNMVLLTSVTIPNSIVKIGIMAFAYNEITRITFGSNIEEIGRAAFSNNQITTLTIPNKLKIIDEEVFFINQIETIVIPNNVTAIGTNAFDHNPLKSISLGTGIKDIFPYAFGRNNQITSITIGNNVNIERFGSTTGLETGFINFYISQNKRSGGYEKTGSIWKRQ